MGQSRGVMEALRSLSTLTWPLLMLISTQAPLVEGHPPPPPAAGGNFSTRSQRYSPNPLGVKSSCSGGVQGYPVNWPNSHYYQRLCQTSSQGLAVVTDGLASDAALERTAWTLDMMMQTMDSYVANSMKEAGFRQAVMGRYPSETVTSLPEYSNQDPSFWNNRRGCGGTEYTPVGCNAEEDVLCYPDDLYPSMDITVHEFGHSLHWLGFNRLWPEFQVDLDACFANAYANSLWGWGYVGSYSMTNSDEYFANGLMTYFDVQYPYDEAAPATREELFQMDPQFAAFLDRWMYHNPWRGGCP